MAKLFEREREDKLFTTIATSKGMCCLSLITDIKLINCAEQMISDELYFGNLLAKGPFSLRPTNVNGWLDFILSEIR
jgi:hypothetical protein